MAPPISPVLRRAALSVLDVNTPGNSTTSSSIKPSLNAKSPHRASVTSPMAPGARRSLPSPSSRTPLPTSTGTPLGIAKRKIAVLGEETPGGRAGKYACVEESVEVEAQAHMDRQERVQVGERVGEETGNQEGGNAGGWSIRERETHRSSQGTAGESSSPSSTFDTTEDSQDTVITEPEDIASLQAVAGIGNISPMAAHQGRNPAEVRELAQTLKLRLQVALYKIRTNQLDLPLAQLEIRSTGPQARVDPEPKSNRLSLNLEDTPVWNVRSSPPMSASPPVHRRYPSSRNSPSKLALATPLLPRSRDELKLSTPELQDLTSSVVKGRAADGLLRLMGATA